MGLINGEGLVARSPGGVEGLVPFDKEFVAQDSFDPRPGHLCFSWDSMRKYRHNPRNGLLPPGNRILRRLDRIYFSQGVGRMPGECSSTILPGFAFLDHAPIWGTLSFGISHMRPSCYRMNAAHFGNPTLKERIKTMWEAVEQKGILHGWSPSVTLQKCIGQARKIDRSWGKRMAKEKRLRLDGLQASLAMAQMALERDPLDVVAQMNLSTRKEELLMFCAAQANWVEMIMQARWIMEGDRGTTLFYKSFKSLAAAKESMN